jgi:hypothetical protein
MWIARCRSVAADRVPTPSECPGNERWGRDGRRHVACKPHPRRVIYWLKEAWSDGSKCVIFEPLDFVSKLLPLAPPLGRRQPKAEGARRSEQLDRAPSLE